MKPLLAILAFLLLAAPAGAYQWRTGDRTNTLALAAAETLDDEA